MHYETFIFSDSNLFALSLKKVIVFFITLGQQNQLMMSGFPLCLCKLFPCSISGKAGYYNYLCTDNIDKPRNC